MNIEARYRPGRQGDGRRSNSKRETDRDREQIKQPIIAEKHEGQTGRHEKPNSKRRQIYIGSVGDGTKYEIN